MSNEKHRDSGDSETDYAQLELQDRLNPLPGAQTRSRPKPRHTASAQSSTLTAPLLDDTRASLSRTGSQQYDFKYRPEVTEDFVHRDKVEYHTSDWIYFLLFLSGVYGALLAMLYGMLGLMSKDSFLTGMGCLALFGIMGIGLVAVIIRGEVKHYATKRRDVQPISPSVH